MNDNVLLGIRILEKLGAGHENALPLKELCRKLDTRNERKVRLAIESLRHEGYPIVIAPEKPFGYFMVNNKQELDDFIKYFRSRIIGECLILAKVKKSGLSKLQKNVQLPLML